MSRGLAAALLLGGLACGGLVAPEPDDGADPVLASWTLDPGDGEPPVTLNLILDDRVAAVVGGRHTGEFEIPPVPEDRRGERDRVLTRHDLDGDGLRDLGVRDDSQSDTFNVAYAWFRYDRSIRSFRRCTDLEGEVGVEPLADGRIAATRIANGRASKGSTTFFQVDGGCTFTPIATLTWDISLQSGNGTASCTRAGEDEPQWRMPVRARPDRACPDPDGGGDEGGDEPDE